MKTIEFSETYATPEVSIVDVDLMSPVLGGSPGQQLEDLDERHQGW